MSDKQIVRAHVRATRALRESHSGAELAAQLAALVTASGARTVTSFVSVNGEPDTAPFHEWAHASGVRVLLPCVLPDYRLEWAAFDGDSMAIGEFGIPEPSSKRLGTEAAAAAELMFVPAATVDRRGVRLGWGRGFYDRALAEIRANRAPGPTVYAVVFDDEVVDRLPAELHDEPVTGAVTELHTYHFG